MFAVIELNTLLVLVQFLNISTVPNLGTSHSDDSMPEITLYLSFHRFLKLLMLLLSED